MLYLQPSTEVVGKVSLLLPYHIFFSGANTTRKLQFLEATHRSPTSLTNVEYYAWNNLCLTKPNIAEGGGAGQSWNEPTFSILLSLFVALEQRYAMLRGVKTWNWKQNSRQNAKIPNKANRKLMTRTIIRTSRHTESGIRAEFLSWSAIQGAFQIRESA